MKTFKPTKEAIKLFHDATLVLSQIEANGMRIDMDYLNAKEKEVTAQIKELETKLKQAPEWKTWTKRFGNKAKLGSKEQLGKVVFDILGYKRNPHVAKTGTDRDADSEAAFAHVDLPFVKEYFRVQKLHKAKGTYLNGIKREVVDGFIHPNFNLHLMVTYRSSSDNPNFQNIPVRNPEIAKLVRTAYIAREGHQLVEVDFGGIEVRVACCYTKDPRLIDEFTTEGKDPHRDTACELFMLTKDQVSKKTTRHLAKNEFVFPEFYGAVYFQQAPRLWQQLKQMNAKIEGTDTLVIDHLKKKGITKLGNCEPGVDTEPGTFVHHVKQVEDGFWNRRFTVYTEWKRKWWKDYLRNGGIQMKTGFCCTGPMKRNEVLNYAIQGGGFHWLTWSLIQIQRWLNKNKMKTKIVGQIHDSIVADVHQSELKDYLDKCKEVITVDLPNHWEWIIVPVAVEMEVCEAGGSWYDKKAVQW